MKRSITRWITTLSTAAALGVPAIATAQTPEPQAPPQQQTPPRQQAPPSQPQPTEQPAAQAPAKPDADKALTPQEHLSEAKAALEKIQPASLTGRARTQVGDLKRHLTALERAASAKAADPAQGAPAGAAPSWGTDAAAMDKILTELLGADSATGTSGRTSTPGATGSAGASPSKAATAVALDETTRAALMDVRKHITAFATGMSGAAAPREPKEDAAMTPAEQSPATPAEQPRTTAEQQPAPTPEQPAPTPEQPAAAPAQQPAPAAAAAAQPQGEQEAARRHLTAARDSLNQLTQLPAAAQLTGEHRTQVTQLIANFNELITTQSQWRASYDKVAANLTAVLGDNSAAAAPAPAAPATPGTPPAGTPPTAGSTAAPGAVGTSGIATGELDPAIRAKLVELRGHLTEFEKAMSGPAK